jgi:hypothetical protein
MSWELVASTLTILAAGSGLLVYLAKLPVGDTNDVTRNTITEAILQRNASRECSGVIELPLWRYAVDAFRP